MQISQLHGEILIKQFYREEDDLSGRLFMHFQEKDGLNWEKWVQLLHWIWGGVGSECPYSWCSRILQVSSAHLLRGLALRALQLDASSLWFQQGSPVILSLVMAMDNLIFGMVKSMHLHSQRHGVLLVPSGWWSIRPFKCFHGKSNIEDVFSGSGLQTL